jgi:menaquinone-dependent protoporphyrinogen oxidase
MSDTLHADRSTVAGDPIGSHGPSVLVAYATTYGSTKGIAERIAAVMGDAGLRVRLRRADEGLAAGAYDAVVFGSPVFDQRWLPEGDAFVARNRQALAQRPVWLFSVGTFGDRKRLIGGVMRREPKNIGEVLAAVAPREYRVFAGVIERSQWPAPSRLLYHLLGGRLGDNRDWPEIDAWARAIAAELMIENGSTPETPGRRQP